MTLMIDGADALLSGSVLVPAGVTAAIRTSSGIIKLRFVEVGEAGFTWNNWDLTITSPVNPLGIGFEIPLTQSDGTVVVLAMTVHTVGEGASTQRIVHYSGYRR